MLVGFARWIGFVTMTVALVGSLMLTGGFFWFAAQISDEEVTLERKADGIVALTGAASRIPDAIELLAAERGRRLLITGVHRTISVKEIVRLTPLYSKYFICCIDLDRSALNTFGNALEAKRWTREHAFNSLIVVTRGSTQTFVACLMILLSTSTLSSCIRPLYGASTVPGR